MIEGYSYYRSKDLDGFKDPRLCFKELALAQGFFANLLSNQGGAERAGDEGFGRHVEEGGIKRHQGGRMNCTKADKELDLVMDLVYFTFME